MPVEWITSPDPVDYPEAVAWMEARAAAIRAGTAPEAIWLLEHPPIYTAGTSAAADELVEKTRFPVYATGRGGRYTYHGPGQRVAYVLLDLAARGRDLRRFVTNLEGWVIDVLSDFGIEGAIRDGRVGVWVTRPDGREEKIAAIGIRVRHWVSFHGLSLNVDPDLSHFTGIVPCGISEHGVTSLAALNVPATMADVDAMLKRRFEERFQ